MKSVLISIQPQWCELIASGKKTIEVRKTRPKIETPFKCYIYCSKGKTFLYKNPNNGELFLDSNGGYRGGDYEDRFLTGKVIGSFVCDRVEEYEGEFWDDDTYERIQEPWEPSDFAEYGEYEYDTIGENGEWYGKGIELSKQSCLSWNELRKYVGQGLKDFYCWHITDLKIYDKPKELGEFYYRLPEKVLEKGDYDCRKPWDCCCGDFPEGSDLCENCIFGGRVQLTRAPQSWQYVEQIINR